MRKGFRVGFGIVSLLVTCIITFGWVRSYWVSDSWHITQNNIGAGRGGGIGSRGYALGINRGVLCLAMDDCDDHSYALSLDPPDLPNWQILHSRFGFLYSEYAYGNEGDIEQYYRFEWGEFRLGKVPTGGGRVFIDTRYLTLPFWFLLGIALPASWYGLLPVVRKMTQTQPGHCRRCGYDLRASPERCPECGTSPVP